MYSRTVEIDNEVFEFVQNHAEPLVDDFNSALKKLLGLTKSKTTQSSSIPAPKKAPEPFISSSIPQALSQILEVSHLVTRQGYSRNEATNLVAKRLKVEKQTVLDKYCRQMGLKAQEFDLLLSEPNLNKLKNKLYSKFPGHEKTINSTLQ